MTNALNSFLTKFNLQKVVAAKEYPFVAASCVRDFALELCFMENLLVDQNPHRFSQFKGVNRLTNSFDPRSLRTDNEETAVFRGRRFLMC